MDGWIDSYHFRTFIEKYNLIMTKVDSGLIARFIYHSF